MQYVIMALVGLVVGAIARLIYPGHQSMGWIATIILGIAGSYLAGFVGSLIHKREDGGLHPAGFVYSIIGALVLIFIAHNLLHMV
ncbi:MAG: GlsB/YeaQ/YmgE family stress response membrane protein [Sphingomicrobium sp.]